MTDDLNRTRQQLAEIPGLAAKLSPSLVTAGGDGPRPAPGSRPPVSVELLDLIEGRDLTWWAMLVIDEMADAGIDPEDPPSSRKPTIADNCRWLAANADWIAEHNPEPPSVDHDDALCALYCPDGHYLTGERVRTSTGRLTCRWCPSGFTSAVAVLYWQYRRATGDSPGPRIRCPKCGNRAIRDGQWMRCTEVEDHDRTIKDIEHEWRYRPAAPAAEIAAEFGIDQDKLRDWKRRGRLKAAGTAGRANTYFPWDVFCLLNPSVAEAIAARDEHTAKESA